MNYKDIIKALEIEKEFITTRLQKNTFDLIKLVEKDNIQSFSYQVNDFSRELKNHIFIVLKINSYEHGITLGAYEKLKDFPKAEQIISNKEIFQKISDINDYIYFANQHLANDLPAIKEQTYYSINAVNHLGDFKNNKVSLLPEFMKKELQPMCSSFKSSIH